MVVARFLIDTCKVKLPVSPSACACLEVSGRKRVAQGGGGWGVARASTRMRGTAGAF
jgi:hypothetical protein